MPHDAQWSIVPEGGLIASQSIDNVEHNAPTKVAMTSYVVS
jgi:hypothetical protein